MGKKKKKKKKFRNPFALQVLRKGSIMKDKRLERGGAFNKIDKYLKEDSSSSFYFLKILYRNKVIDVDNFF